MDRFFSETFICTSLTVVNNGISGNRLLTDGMMGDSVLKRLNSEIFQYSGVKTLIVLVGINDISYGTAFAPKQQIPSFEALTQGYRRVVSDTINIIFR